MIAAITVNNLRRMLFYGISVNPGRLGVELCADVIVSAAARRSISVGGGGGARRGRPKTVFLRFTKKFRSILKMFLETVLVIKALSFADDQCYSGQFIRPAKNDGSIDYGVSELQLENKY